MDFETFRDSYPLPIDRSVFGVAQVASASPVTLSRPPVAFDGYMWLNLVPSRNRVLLTNQPNPRDNGIYEARATGAGPVGGFQETDPNTLTVVPGLVSGQLYFIETIDCEVRGLAVDPAVSFLLQQSVRKNSTGFIIAGGSTQSAEIQTFSGPGQFQYRPAALFRVADADDDLDFFIGKRVSVRLGETMAGNWIVSKLGSTRPITLGSAITFEKRGASQFQEPNFVNSVPHPNQSFTIFQDREPVLVTPDFLRLPDNDPLAVVVDGQTHPITAF